MPFTTDELSVAAITADYLTTQSVVPFADAAARDAAIPTPDLNQLTMLNTAPGVVQFWDGSAWADTGNTGPAGPAGPAGTTGADGPAGPGVAVGGTVGQVLAKKTTTNYDTEWIAPPSGGVTSVDSRTGVVTLSDKYVDVVGDTMTGQLVINPATAIPQLKLSVAGVTQAEIRAATSGIGIGTSALGLATSTGGVGIGYQSGMAATSAVLTAVGYQAGKAVTTATGNTMVGYQAGLVSTGANNTFIGKNAGDNLTTGTQNIIIGAGTTGGNMTTASDNVVVGVGVSAGASTAQAVGIGTGTTINSDGVSVGYQASGSTAAVAIGSTAKAGGSAPGGGVSIGYQAGMATNINSNGFTTIGYQAGKAVTTGTNNTFVGFQAGLVDVGGADNTLLGYTAGVATTGSNNTFLGSLAGLVATTGSSNVAIGKGADVAAAISYATAIGAQAKAQASGAVAIGIDSGGAGATTAVANEIKLGTANHTTNIIGTLQVAPTKGIVQGSAGPLWRAGTGSPEGVVTAPIGSIYSRSDGGTDTAIYRKESGTGNTGWVAVAAGGGSVAAHATTHQTGGTDPLTGRLALNVGSNGTVVLGAGAQPTNASNVVAVGTNALGVATATMGSNTAIGSSAFPSLASGAGNVAVGNYSGYSMASADGVIMIGDSTKGAAGIARAIAIGYAAQATVTDVVAIGPTVNATHTNSFALGSSSTANNDFVLGNTSHLVRVPGGKLGLGTIPTAALHFAASTGAAGGILFGTDTTLYRSAADVLTTDDMFVAASFRQGASGPTWTTGSAAPEASVTAPIGSIYSRSSGSTGTTFYIKETGAGNVGWVPVAAGGGGGAPEAGWSVTAGYTVDKAFNPADTTMNEMANVLGSLIDALIRHGELAA